MLQGSFASIVTSARDFVVTEFGPNPARRQFVIGYDHMPGAPVEIEMIDVTGRRVRTWTEPPSAPVSIRRQIELDGVAPGSYLLRLRQGSKVAARKLSVVE